MCVRGDLHVCERDGEPGGAREGAKEGGSEGGRKGGREGGRVRGGFETAPGAQNDDLAKLDSSSNPYSLR